MDSTVYNSAARRMAAEPPLRSPRLVTSQPRVTGQVRNASEAFEVHFTLVWRTLRRLGVRKDLLDDATQDVFLVVHRRWQAFEGRSQLKTWLLGIALRVASDYRRKQRRIQERFIPESEPVAIEHQDPERVYASRQAGQLLYQALDALKPQDREVLVLVDLEQSPVAEAAEALNVNVNTAYSRLRVARQKFEASLERQRKRESGGRK